MAAGSVKSAPIAHKRNHAIKWWSGRFSFNRESAAPAPVIAPVLQELPILHKRDVIITVTGDDVWVTEQDIVTVTVGAGDQTSEAQTTAAADVAVASTQNVQTVVATAEAVQETEAKVVIVTVVQDAPSSAAAAVQTATPVTEAAAQTTTCTTPVTVAEVETTSAAEAAQTTTSAAEAAQTTTSVAEAAQTTTPVTEATQTTTPVIETAQTTAQTVSDSSSTTSTVSESSPETSTSSESASSTGASSTGSFATPETLTYSPYNDDSTCKDASTVLTDLKLIASKGIGSIRMYATDCGSISTVQPACLELGLLIDQGFWIDSSGVDSVDSSVQDIIDWVENSNDNDWSIFKTFTVGNEAIYSGYATGSALLEKIKSVKATLQAAGYTGTVTTAEPPQSYISNTDLCTDTDGIDYVGVNAHPYFNSGTSAATAGEFILSQISAVEAVCDGRTVSITETGYPSAGNTNGNNVPTPANQAIAIKNIMSALDNKGVMFTTYDDKWKTPGPYNVEQHFGIIGLFS